jgi:hypothetical protein
MYSWANEAFGTLPDATNIWIGDDRAISSTHKDPYENIYCVVSGSKQFTLLPPTDTCFLYRRMYKSAKYNQDFNIIELDYELPWVSVDPEFPDYNLFPLFKHASPIQLTLEKGDILYLPSLWYHKVSQKKRDEEAAVAVNFWYDMKFDARYSWTRFQDELIGFNS